MTLGIRARLLAAFSAVALFTGALGWYTLQTLERVKDSQRTVYGDVFGGTNLLANWVDVSRQNRENLLSILLSEDPSGSDPTRAEIAALDQQLAEIARQMDVADTDREDVETLASLTAAWQTYATWRDTAVIGALERGDRSAALTAYRIEGRRLDAALDATIDAFLTKKQTVGANLEATAEASYELTRRIAIVISAAAAGFGLAIGFFLSRSIADAVEQVAGAAKGLAVGNLNQRINVRSRDELGQMADAFREMITYQQDMAAVATAMARGDLTHNVRPKGPTDQLGTAFQHMIANLRTLVGQLERAEAKFRGLLESAPDAIVTVNREGRIALVNTQAERVFGYDRSELLGQMIEIVLPESLAELHKIQQPAGYSDARGGRPMGMAMELRARRKDGSEFPVEISLSPMQSDDGVLTTSVIRDITERRRAEANQRFLSEASALLAVSLDYETTLASIARLAVPFLADGCNIDVVEEDGTAHSVADVSTSGASVSEQLRNVRLKPLDTAQPYLLSERPEHPTDPEALVVLRAAGLGAAMLVPLVVRGRPLGVISFVVGAAGREYTANDFVLAQELAHRCAIALENAHLYREAQTAIQLRDEFFSVASHELKTPVAALLAFTQFILKRAQRQHGLGRAQVREVLEEVHWQADRVGRLVSQLLDTSRLDAGKLTLEPELTDIVALVTTAVHTAMSNTDKHTITVVAPSEAWAVVDPIYFCQVITNLLDNACKYSPQGGPIEVEIGSVEGGRIRLCVRDHGIGVPPEHRPHIFDRFYQAQAPQHTSGVAGLGLGLYISKRIVELHGGSIELDAPRDGGARIVVSVPVGDVSGAGQSTSRRARGRPVSQPV